MVKAVIFDKDGTLIEFSDIWALATEEFIQDLDLGEEKEGSLRKNVGILGDGQVQADSPLGSGTNQDIADALGVDLADLEEKFSSYLDENSQMIKATADLIEILPIIKDKGIKIGLVTSDSYDLTIKQLQILAIDEYFDFIYTGDMDEVKPSPAIIKDVEEKYGIDSDEMVYVGDTKTDMDFGKNVGKVYGIRSGVSPDNIEDMADEVLGDLGEILNII